MPIDLFLGYPGDKRSRLFIWIIQIIAIVGGTRVAQLYNSLNLSVWNLKSHLWDHLLIMCKFFCRRVLEVSLMIE